MNRLSVKFLLLLAIASTASQLAAANPVLSERSPSLIKGETASLDSLPESLRYAVTNTLKSGVKSIYGESGGTLEWLEQKIAGSSGASFDGFGYSIALDNNTAIIGAPALYAGGKGAAYIFTNTDGVWAETQKLVADDGMDGDTFGYSVALSGSTALIGSMAAVGTNDHQGVAYVFSESGGIWTQDSKLVADDGMANSRFGTAMAIDGATATVLISAPGDSGGAGSAYIFNEFGGIWTQTQKLTPSTVVSNGWFGLLVSLDGTRALIGEIGPFSNIQGRAYIFENTGGVWTETQMLMADDGVTNDQFGYVAISGATAVIGAPNANMGEQFLRGAAYVFKEIDGSWVQIQKIVAVDGVSMDQFGSSIALDGTSALVGASSAPASAMTGAAYMFTESGGVWSQSYKFSATDGTPGDWYGFPTILKDGVVVIGSFNAMIQGNQNQGAAYFYSVLSDSNDTIFTNGFDDL